MVRAKTGSDGTDRSSARLATLAAGGLDPPTSGPINPAVQRASTILYPTVDEYMRRHDGFYDDVIYGLYGTETTYALASAVAALEGAHMTVVTSSGTAAIALGLSTFVSAGDHLLVADTVYGATRRFCEEVLKRYNVSVEYFDPLMGGDIVSLFTSRTRAIFMESPGSQTFEVMDVLAITAQARPRGIVTLIDNTWATPLLFRPLEHGVDVSIQSATKYLSGHSDVMLGTLSAVDESLYKRLKDTVGRWGNCAGPDECYLVHRGLRTLDVRLERHQRNALALIEWLLQRPEVERVLYPALPSDPGHTLWKRDFSGASGLFGVVLKPGLAVPAFRLCENRRHFRIGSSWGGYESLLVPAWPAPTRQFRSAPPPERLLRIHAGLEDPADLITDLDEAFEMLSGGPR